MAPPNRQWRRKRHESADSHGPKGPAMPSKDKTPLPANVIPLPKPTPVPPRGDSVLYQATAIYVASELGIPRARWAQMCIDTWLAEYEIDPQAILDWHRRQGENLITHLQAAQSRGRGTDRQAAAE